jgi:competence ComEA-like helix-hairpin-helix protein
MVKVSANTATREELLEVAGLRPEIADAILEFRGRHGRITSIDALEELPGVGPATVEQLRKALDVSDEAAKGGGRSTRETADKSMGVTPSAMRQVADAGARASAARSGLQVVQKGTGAVGEMQREAVRESAEDIAVFGQLVTDLLNEQIQHNLHVALALGQTINWEEVAQAQSDFFYASCERLNRLSSGYLEIVQAMMGTTASAGSDEARKAA